MAIIYVGISNAAGENNGATGASTVPITPTLPPSTAAGDRIYIFQAATAATMSTPSSWTAVTINQTAGSGAVAAGSGMRYFSVYFRDYDGVWSMPTLALTSASNLSHWIAAVSIRPTSSGYAFIAPTYTTPGGDYGTADTNHSDTSASFTTHSGGFLIIGSLQNDNVTSTGGTLSQSGASFFGVSERADGGTSTGNDVSGTLHTASINTGATGTMTFTKTLSAASQGATQIVEQTEIALGSAISTLTDDFNTGSTPDAGKWSTYAGSPVLTSGQLNLDTPSSATSPGIVSLGSYDLMGGSVTAKLVTASTISGASDAQATLSFGSSSLTTASWSIQGTTATPILNGVSGTSVTHTDGNWYQLFLNSGQQYIYTRYSNNGIQWKDQYWVSISGFNQSDLRNGKAYITGGVATNHQATVRWDNLNYFPPGALVSTFTDDFSGTLAQWSATLGMYPGSSGTSIVSGQAVVSGGSNGDEYGISTNNYYVLDESSIVFKLDPTSTMHYSGTTGVAGATISFAGKGFVFVDSNIKDATTGTTVGWSISANPYLKISHTGSTVTTAYSSNGTSWTTLDTHSASGITGVITLDTYTDLSFMSAGNLTVDYINLTLNKPDFFKMFM